MKTKDGRNNSKISEENEIPLKGGRVTSDIVKINNTVHRLQQNNSRFVHELLRYLEKIDFNGTPRFLGIDSKSREIFSYIEGNVPTDLKFFPDEVLVNAAKLIKKYHDATIGFSKDSEIICHNDLSPCNTVFQQGNPIAFIDFDAAAPGKRIDDVAYAIWLWCDLGNEENSPMYQSYRIQLFCYAYGLDEIASIIDAIIDIQKLQIIKYDKNVNKGMLEWADAVSWAKKCLAWVEDNRAILQKFYKEEI